MEISNDTTAAELVAIIVDKLRQHGIEVVLVGGSVVSIYTANKYASADLDFITFASQTDIAKALIELGFTPIVKGAKDFGHPDTKFTVEFPTPPVAIGDTSPVHPKGEREINGVIFKLLSPTQCVMDRLLIFFLENDRQCLDQAVWVAQQQGFNKDELSEWASREANQKEIQRKLNVFFRRLDQ